MSRQVYVRHRTVVWTLPLWDQSTNLPLYDVLGMIEDAATELANDGIRREDMRIYTEASTEPDYGGVLVSAGVSLWGRRDATDEEVAEEKASQAAVQEQNRQRQLAQARARLAELEAQG